MVAPFAGAWIETITARNAEGRSSVAPFAGAWIETKARSRKRSRRQSRPSRARGLKQAEEDDGRLHHAGRALRGRVD